MVEKMGNEVAIYRFRYALDPVGHVLSLSPAGEIAGGDVLGINLNQCGEANVI